MLRAAYYNHVEYSNTHAMDGMSLIDCSSELIACESSHVLTDDPHKLWLSDEGLPQYLTFEFNPRVVPCLRSFGWACQHLSSYAMNPSLIELRGSSDGTDFDLLISSVQGEMVTASIVILPLLSFVVNVP